jgi:hypothetical protein
LEKKILLRWVNQVALCVAAFLSFFFPLFYLFFFFSAPPSNCDSDDFSPVHSLMSNEGSLIEHKSQREDHKLLAGELAFLMNEVQRVAGLQEEVIRQMDDAENTSEDQSVSFEKDEDEDFYINNNYSYSLNPLNESNIDPSIRNEILDEFDSVIERNEFIDAELLQPLLERLWDITDEKEKQKLINQLQRGGGGGGLSFEEGPSEVAVFEEMNTSVSDLANDCAEDIAKVENCISFCVRKIKELCEDELPFTVFNTHLLSRCEDVVKTSMKMHRLNLLIDSVLIEAIHAVALKYERTPVGENIDSLVSDLSDLLYDEMLFANLYLKQNSEFEQISEKLREEQRRLESRVERLRRAQDNHQETLMRERKARLRKNDVSFGMEYEYENNPIIAQSPGGAFVDDDDDDETGGHRGYSPTARRGLIDYEHYLEASSPMKLGANSATSRVNKSLLENYKE